MRRFALIVTVITLEAAKSMQCSTACGWAGYDQGFFKDDQCHCVDVKPYDEFSNKHRLMLPSKRTKQTNSQKTYDVPYSSW